MITDGVAEILVGVIVDPQFGQVLVLGAGGVLTELMSDSVSLLPPWTDASIRGRAAALDRRQTARTGIAASLRGDVDALDRHHPGRGALRDATMLAELVELDVNPVIVRPAGHGAVAVDAMIRLQTILLKEISHV